MHTTGVVDANVTVRPEDAVALREIGDCASVLFERMPKLMVCGCIWRTGTRGSTMVPFATPSSSPNPPSVNCSATVSPEIVAIEDAST